MPKNLFQSVVMKDGTVVEVHVNRRGCKGRWTKESQSALAEMVRALHAMTPDQIKAMGKRASSHPVPSEGGGE